MLRTATNIMGINTHRSLKTVSERSEKSSEKLSSGLKINRAADDAAGLAISEKMRNQIKGLQMAQKNVEDGISLIQTAEGGMQEISEMVKRQRELIIQAMNDTNTDEDKDKIQAEIDQLKYEIDSTANKTEFNGIPLLNANTKTEYSRPHFFTEFSSVALRPGESYDVYIDINALNYPPDAPSGDIYSSFFDFRCNVFGRAGIPFPDECTVTSPNGNQYSFSMASDANQLINLNLDFADLRFNCSPENSVPPNVSGGFYSIAVEFNRDSSKYQNWEESDGQWKISFSNISGVDTYISLGNYGNSYPLKIILPEPPLHIQSGANENQGMYIDRYDCRPKSLGINNIVVKPIEVAEKSLGQLDNAVETINTYRATAGAQQNRLEHTSNNLGVSFLNLEDANSNLSSKSRR